MPERADPGPARAAAGGRRIGSAITVRPPHSNALGPRHASRRVLLLTAALLGVLAAAGPSSPSPSVATAPGGPAARGRAVAVSVQGVLGDRTVADTGEITDPASSPARRRVLDLPGPPLRAAVAEVGVVLASPGPVTAQASVTDLRLDLIGGEDRSLPLGDGPPLLSVALGPVTATSRSDCTAGSRGEVGIGSVTVNNIRVIASAAPVPNTRVSVAGLPLVTLVLNEQVPVPVPGGSGLVVNGLHLVVVDLLDLVVASARSEVGACPAPVQPAVAIDPGVVRQGRVAIARGTGFASSSVVRATFDGTDIRPVEAVSGPDGSLEVAVVVPRDARLGTRTVSAGPADRPAAAAVTATFLVVRPPTGPPGGAFGTGG